MQILSSLLAVLAPTLAAAPAPAAPAPQAADVPDLKTAIDRSVRWLRSTQDPVTGAYGGGVEPTAWTLIALGHSPRHYTPHDGPFVRRALDYLVERQTADGAVHDEGAGAPQQLEQTMLALVAFTYHATPESMRAASRGLAWLNARGEEPAADGFPPRHPDLAELTSEKALAFAVKRLAERNDDGSWPGTEANGGAVQGTARAIYDLSACYAVLKPAKKDRSVSTLPAASPADAQAIDAAMRSGARFLVEAGTGPGWGAPGARGAKGAPDAGITAMVLAALQALPEPRPEPVQAAIDRGLAWLAGLQHEDGSIHDGKLHNYVTSASILALTRAGDAYAEQVTRARNYLVHLQADEGEGYSSDHHYYGGVGYGGDERPDLSNLQMALEALSASGLESDHEAYERALTFLQRCQNRSESNDLALDDGSAVLVAGDDGGSAYAPGNSPAGYIELDDGQKVARSYGSMSYALLKSYIFAGLEKDDPRVEALWKWLQEHYTLDVNPGFEYVDDPSAAYQGLFYYFNTMARALDLYGVEEVTDRHGVTHAWRSELAGRLLAMQSRTDGSWTNENAPRWWEGNPVLATAYALTTLELTRPR